MFYTHRAAGGRRSFAVPGMSVSAMRVQQRGCLATSTEDGPYEFDCDLLIVEQVGAFEQNTEGAFANLLAHAVMHANHVTRG